MGNQRGKSQGDSQNSGKSLTAMLAGLTQKLRRNFRAYIKKFSFNHSRSFRQSADSVFSFIFIFSHSHSTYLLGLNMSTQKQLRVKNLTSSLSLSPVQGGAVQQWNLSEMLFSFLRGLYRTAEIK